MSETSPSEGMPSALPNSDLAVVSLVAGILGVTVLPVVGSIVALITGYMARKEIQESAGTVGGETLATAGLVLGWVGVGLLVLGFCVVGAFILVPLCAVLFGLVAEATSSWLPILLLVI